LKGRKRKNFLEKQMGRVRGKAVDSPGEGDPQKGGKILEQVGRVEGRE